MKRFVLFAVALGLIASAFAPTTARAQKPGPDTYYFELANGKIYWERVYELPISQKDLAERIKATGAVTNVSQQPGVITCTIPMHPVRYEGAGIRPEYLDLALTSASVSAKATIRMEPWEQQYRVTVRQMVLDMAKPSEAYPTLAGKHAFEYHFRHPMGVIRNTFYNTFLANGVDFDFDRIFDVSRHGTDAMNKE